MQEEEKVEEPPLRTDLAMAMESNEGEAKEFSIRRLGHTKNQELDDFVEDEEE